MSSILPPFVIDVRVRERGERNFRFWLPFFLLWPVLLVFYALGLILTLVIDLALWLSGARYHHLSALLLNSLRLLAAVRGTRVRVDSDTTFVRVNIY
jgi:hypothetical protein